MRENNVELEYDYVELALRLSNGGVIPFGTWEDLSEVIESLCENVEDLEMLAENFMTSIDMRDLALSESVELTDKATFCVGSYTNVGFIAHNSVNVEWCDIVERYEVVA